MLLQLLHCRAKFWCFAFVYHEKDALIARCRTISHQCEIQKVFNTAQQYCTSQVLPEVDTHLADAFDNVFRVGLMQQLAQCQPRARLQAVQLQRPLVALSGLHLLAFLAEVMAQACKRGCLRGAVHTGRVQERFVRVGCILCTLLPALVCSEQET